MFNIKKVYCCDKVKINNDLQLLAVGDAFGNIYIYRFPAFSYDVRNFLLNI